MNWKTWVPLALAIVLGLVAMKIAKDVIANKTKEPAAAAKMQDVVVLKVRKAAGSALRRDDLQMGKMSADVVGDSICRSIDELDGRVLAVSMSPGQPLLESLLTPKGTGSGLQALVPKGMRAVTVEINEFSGVAGFLIAGCQVDIVSTIAGDNGEMLSRTVVQNVKVTAVGRRQSENPEEAPEQSKSVTLLVTPKQAEAIELATAMGRPRLVLRSSGDNSHADSEGMTVAELRGRSRRDSDPWSLPVEFIRTPSPATQPSDQSGTQADARRRTVKVIRGGQEQHLTFELPSQSQQSGGKIMTNAN